MELSRDYSSIETIINPREHRARKRFLILLPICLFVLSFALGRYAVAPGQLLSVLAARIFPIDVSWPSTVETVIFQVRLPRIILALLIGAALSVSGCAFQGMFKNPLVSPDILGASAGAGFGAALAIYFSFNTVGIQLMAFLFGLIAVSFTYYVGSKIRNHDSMLGLVLCGIVIGAMFSAAICLIKYIADPNDKLPAITIWLMGSLASTDAGDILMIAIPVVAGLIPLYLLRWRLNVLSLGEEESQALGLDVRKLKILVILCATLMTSASVAVAGVIGWVGLLIPHLSRMIVGPNYASLIPASILIGSSYLLIVDDMARLLGSMEIPLGILTSLIGAPFFLYLLLNSKWGWK